MDRFDEMRAKSNKNSGGGGGGSTGSSEFNVFLQTTEPEKKDGIWCKDSGSFNGAKFFVHAGKKGEILENSKLEFLKPTATAIAQEIIDGWLYVIGDTTATSYKINLKTQSKQSINVPNAYVGSACGSVYYDEKIYVFYQKAYYFYWFSYDPSKNTYTTPVDITTSNAYESKVGGLGVHLYNGKAYILYANSDSGITYFVFDFSNNTISDKKTVNKLYGYANAPISGVGKYIYSVREYSSTFQLCRLDLTDNTSEVLTDLPKLSTFSQHTIPYATEKYVYLFYRLAQNGYNTYLKYDIDTGELETITTENLYYCYGNSGSGNRTYTCEQFLLDEKTGILYLRFAGNPISSYIPASAMQLDDMSEINELADGTLVVIQSISENIVKIHDASSLHAGIENVYIKRNEELETDIICFLGDGEKWYLLKNPSEQTATVTFEGIGSQQVIIGQKVSKPAQNPSKDGYIFDYWELDGKPYNFNSVIVGDTTLNVKWCAYEEIEYIESTGTQYIDTGIKPTTGTTYEISVDITEQTEKTDMCLFGSRPGSGSQQFIVWDGYNTDDVSHRTIPVLGSLSSEYYYSPAFTKNVFKYDGTKFYCNNVEVFTITNSTGACDFPLFLFALNNGGTADSRRYQGKLYYFKIYQDGVLVRDYVPIKTEDGVYCLLDKVNNILYANAGTGSFIAG